jgi:hypothetical protein
MRNVIFSGFFLNLWFHFVFGQIDPVIPFNTSVNIDGNTLGHAFQGGMNSPQFSLAQLNRDTCLDLFVFDRGGDKVMVFMGSCENETLSYVYDPSVAGQFPELHDWALLKDFNDDGAIDIFTASDPGIQGVRVFRGAIDDAGLTFSLIPFSRLPFPVLTYSTGSGYTQIFVNRTDIPSIGDFDSDGDLDILTFDLDGSRLFFYNNVVVERRLSRDTLVYELQDDCWGRAIENFFDNTIILSDDPEICPLVKEQRRLHSGSTISSFDHDSDGDLDLLIGDISFSNLIFLRNGGNPDFAFIDMQIPSFPRTGFPVDISYFPGSYHIDVNQDGFADLLASPNTMDALENVDVSWLYIRDPQTLEFELVHKDFMVNNMLDFGINAKPHFVDINGDDLTDLLVGTRYERNFNPMNPSTILYFENIGTDINPSFQKIDIDLIPDGLPSGEVDALAPCSGDMDGDGDLDIVVGTRKGKLIYIENAATGAGFEMGTLIFPYFDIDVGSFAIPVVFDLNGDGLLDLIIGEESGSINFLLNRGNKNQPVFDPNLGTPGNTPFLGHIDTREQSEFLGYSSPIVFIYSDQLYIVTGSNSGHFKLYEASMNATQEFDLIENEFGAIKDGFRSSADLADIDQDGFLEMVCGNSRGGLTMYKTKLQGSTTGVHTSDPVVRIHSYPNPTRDQLHLKCDLRNDSNYIVYDLAGKIVSQAKFRPQPDGVVTLNVSGLKTGIYVLFIYKADSILSSRFMVQD